jgi:hypothetical protein
VATGASWVEIRNPRLHSHAEQNQFSYPKPGEDDDNDDDDDDETIFSIVSSSNPKTKIVKTVEVVADAADATGCKTSVATTRNKSANTTEFHVHPHHLEAQKKRSPITFLLSKKTHLRQRTKHKSLTRAMERKQFLTINSPTTGWGVDATDSIDATDATTGCTAAASTTHK